MSWGEESAGHAQKMELLPSARVLDVESLHLFGVGATAPEIQAIGEGSGSAPVQTSSGQSTTRRRLSPRHRRAVKTFFTGGE